MLILFNENSVIPQRKQMGNCAGVLVCIYIFVSVFTPTYKHVCWLTVLSANTCIDVLDSLILNYL